MPVMDDDPPDLLIAMRKVSLGLPVDERMAHLGVACQNLFNENPGKFMAQLGKLEIDWATASRSTTGPSSASGASGGGGPTWDEKGPCPTCRRLSEDPGTERALAVLESILGVES